MSSALQKYAPIIEPFSQASKTQIALINVVQVYCYEDAKVMKAFPQILKVRYTFLSLYMYDLTVRHAGIVQHRLCIRPSYYLLAPESVQA